MLKLIVVAPFYVMERISSWSEAVIFDAYQIASYYHDVLAAARRAFRLSLIKEAPARN